MELKHCIAAHHGSLEFGSPKTPALAEAMALSFADDMDAKLEVITELLGASDKDPTEWLGFNRWINSNLRKTII
jgi:3'-5' exoribonuclease